MVANQDKFPFIYSYFPRIDCYALHTVESTGPSCVIRMNNVHSWLVCTFSVPHRLVKRRFGSDVTFLVVSVDLRMDEVFVIRRK